MRSRFRARRYGPVTVRVGLAGTVVAAVCLAQLGSTSGADTSFSEGTASAGSQAIAIAPTVSSLSIGVILGSSLADYINSEGQALAQTFDGGALVTTLEAPNCATGGPGTVKASDFPTPAQAESTNGNQTVTMTAYDTLNTAVAGLGVETATATTEPSGTATNTISSETLADIATISGATATSTAEVQNGNTRYASATADISSVSLAKGLIVLKGLHWVATQTSGASNTSTASFDIGGLTVAGANVPISTDSITTVLAIINTALSPIGFQIDWPAVTTLPDGTINISALKIGLDDSALGQELIGSNLYKAQTVRNVLQQELFDINCNTASAFTVSDVGVGILAGAGDLDVLLGGAHALTNDQGEASPFGSGSLPSSGLSLAAGAAERRERAGSGDDGFHFDIGQWGIEQPESRVGSGREDLELPEPRECRRWLLQPQLGATRRPDRSRATRRARRLGLHTSTPSKAAVGTGGSVSEDGGLSKLRLSGRPSHRRRT